MPPRPVSLSASDAAPRPVAGPALTDLSAQTGRYHDMFLILLHPSRVAAEQIREFMTEYLELTEGGVPDDPAAAALFAAIDRPQGIRTRPLLAPAE